MGPVVSGSLSLPILSLHHWASVSSVRFGELLVSFSELRSAFLTTTLKISEEAILKGPEVWPLLCFQI